MMLIKMLKHSKAILLMCAVFLISSFYLILTGTGHFTLVPGENIGYFMLIPAVMAFYAARINADKQEALSRQRGRKP